MTRSLVQPSLTGPLDVPHINGCTSVRNGKFGEQATAIPVEPAVCAKNSRFGWKLFPRLYRPLAEGVTPVFVLLGLGTVCPCPIT